MDVKSARDKANWHKKSLEGDKYTLNKEVDEPLMHAREKPQATGSFNDPNEEKETLSEQASSESSGLEEEDLELLQENLGRSGFRRLQQRGGSLEDEKSQDYPNSKEKNQYKDYSDDDDDDENVRPQRKRVAPEELAKLFEDEEEEETSRRPAKYNTQVEQSPYEESDEDELADFIEDDDGQAEIRPSRRREVDKTFLAETFGGRLPPRVLQDIIDIFGDGSDYLGLVDDDDNGEQSEGKGETDNSARNNSHFKRNEERISKKGTGREKQKMQVGDSSSGTGVASSSSMKIVDTDIPERIQRRDGINRPLPEEGEIEMEAAWIAQRWAQDPISNEKFSSADPITLKATIGAVLKLFRVQKLEVPTVATHRKEYFQHLMGLNDLWAIWDLDEHWKLLRSQQNILCNQIKSDRNPNDERDLLLQVTRATDNLEELEVIAEYLRWFRKQETQRQSEETFQALVSLAHSFTLKMSQFVENMTQQVIVHGPPTPDNDPESMAIKVATETTLPPAQLLNATVSHVAAYIGHHPYGHLSIRATIERLAAITVSPTVRGIDEIDGQHELSPIKYVTNKPVGAFQEDQFLLLVKGEKMGLLNYEIVFPGLEVTIESLTGLYGGAGGGNSDGNSWNSLRHRALFNSIQRFILPRLKRDISTKLRASAERWVAIAGQYLLQDRLMTLPYDPRRYNHPNSCSNGSFRIMAISWGRGGPDAITMAAIIDEKGRLVEQARLSHLHERHRNRGGEDEWTRLMNLVIEHEPSCVLVAGYTLDTRDLRKDVEREIGKIKTKNRRDLIPVIYTQDDTARLYPDSVRGGREWPDANPTLRYCISLGRRWLNPLFELSSLSDSELLMLDSNPLQALVSRDTRLLFLHRAFINVVNLVGVNINDAVTLTWMRSPLCYVCGLGPLKAEALVKSIASNFGGRIASRNELSRLVGPQIFANCASFLTISGVKGKPPIDMLDTTRIHPENYPLARKMAADAMEISFEEVTDANDISRGIRNNGSSINSSGDDGIGKDEQVTTTAMRAVSLVMEQPERLNDLLLDEYAKELVKRGQPSKHLTLLDIKAELQHPYADLRTVNQGPSDEILFEMLTGIDERTLWVGAIVPATVIRASDRIATCRLVESGLDATLPERHSHLRPGQTLRARVASIDPSSFHVDLVEVRPGEPISNRFGFDPYYNSQRSEERRPAMEKPITARAPERRRIISHPAFRDVSRTEAEELLRTAVLGEVVIRPSSRDFDHLTLTWKLDDNPPLFQHFDLKILPNGGYSIGSERYEDLDEVIARHVESLSAYLRDIRATPKFLKVPNIEDVALHLSNERKRDPNRIAYSLSLSRENPGMVRLSHQASNRVHHELLSVTPSGFILRGQAFSTIEQLITWFKQNYRNHLNGNQAKTIESNRITNRDQNRHSREYHPDEDTDYHHRNYHQHRRHR